jgi:hypothetical protein
MGELQLGTGTVGVGYRLAAILKIFFTLEKICGTNPALRQQTQTQDCGVEVP